jgi:hypothetical protein
MGCLISNPHESAMSSTTKPTARARKLFLAGAQGETEEWPVKKSPRVQISVTVAADVLRQLDQLAARYGQTRAGLIGLGIARVLRDGL